MTASSLFGQSGGGTLDNDGSGYTLGMQFSLSQAAPLTGIWWYSVAGAPQLPAQCCIYQVSGQSQVAGTVNTSPSWSGAAASGWVKCSFSGAVILSAGVNYKTCIYIAQRGGAPTGYSNTNNYWSSGAGSGGLSNGIISAPNNAGGDGGQDTFSSPNLGALAYPTNSGSAANFWVDVEVTPAGGAPVALVVPQAAVMQAANW